MLAWIGATVVAIVIAAAAVGSVRSQVTDAPTPLGSPEAAALASTSPPVREDAPDITEPSQAQSLTTSTSVEAAASEPSSTTTTSPPTTTTVAGAATGSSTTTKPPAPPTTVTTTTTEAPTSSYTKTYDMDAGWVRVAVDGDSVTFASASAHPGWRVEVDDEGPEEVKVHFERNDDSDEIRFAVKIKDGELRPKISPKDDD